MNNVYKRLSLLMAMLLLVVFCLPAPGAGLAEEGAGQEAAEEMEKDPYADAIPTLPTLSLTVEYERPSLEGTLTGEATIVCNPPKSEEAVIFDAKDINVTIELTDELHLGEDCKPEFSIGRLASGESYSFPFTLEFDPELAADPPEGENIVPVMTITALSEEIGGCRYISTLDVTPEVNLFLCSINTTPSALNAWMMDKSAKRLEEEFQSLFFEKEKFSIRRFDMDISDPAALSFDVVREAMAAIETDENDLICLYLNAYVPSEKDGSASSFASISSSEEVETDYGELFAWMKEELNCRVLLLIDCETAPAAIRAASVLDQDYCSAVGIDLHADIPRGQSGGYRIQGLLAQTLLDLIESAPASVSLSELTDFFGGDHAANNFFKGMTGAALDAVSCGKPQSPVFALDPEYHSDIWILAVKEEKLAWLSPYGVEVILTTEIEIVDHGDVTSEIVIPTIHISGNSALATRINAQMMEEVNYFRKLRDTESEYYGWHYVDLGVNECFSNGRFLSAAIWWYECYENSAHGTHGLIEYNYDMKTGEPLSIKDMLDPDEPNAEKRLRTLIGNQLTLHHYDDWFGGSSMEIADAFLRGDCGSWMLTDDGLYVFFDLYEIAPYAAGMVNATIPYSQLKHVFDEEFLHDQEIFDGQGSVLDSSAPQTTDEEYRSFGRSQEKAFLTEGKLSQIRGIYGKYNNQLCFYASSMTNAYAWLPELPEDMRIVWKDKDGSHTIYIFGSQTGGDSQTDEPQVQ